MPVSQKAYLFGLGLLATWLLGSLQPVMALEPLEAPDSLLYVSIQSADSNYDDFNLPDEKGIRFIVGLEFEKEWSWGLKPSLEFGFLRYGESTQSYYVPSILPATEADFLKDPAVDPGTDVLQHHVFENSLDHNSLAIGLRLFKPMGNRLGLYGRFLLNRWDQDNKYDDSYFYEYVSGGNPATDFINPPSLNQSDNQFGLMVEVGGAFRLSRHWQLTGSWSRSDFDGSVIDGLAAGIIFNFGSRN